MIEFTTRVSGHFGEWMQGKYGPDGPIALITVPCPVLSVSTTRKPSARLELRFDGPHTAALEQVKRLFDLLGLPQCGTFTIKADMPPGGGAGASTATLVALAQAAGANPAMIAPACVAVEGASDPLMMDAPERHLWSSRQGFSLLDLPPLPEFDIIGGFWQHGALTDPSDQDFRDISDLVPEWINAAQAHKPGALAALASESARRCTQLRGPKNDPTADLARDWGALGHIRAHTGSARGLIFAPGTLPDGCFESLISAGLRQIIRFRTGI